MSSITSSAYPVVTTSNDGDLFTIVRNGQLMKMNRAALQAFIETLTPDNFIALTDTPGTMVGQAGKVPAVNIAEDALEFVAGAANFFVSLTDGPGNFSSNALKVARVNAGETALEYVTQALTLLSDAPSSYSGASEYLVRVNAAANAIEFVRLEDVLPSGWATYVDTQYPSSGAAFTVPATTITQIPNNKGTVNESQKPADVTTFYDGSVITGRNGDGLGIMIYFKAVPTSASQYLDVWIDIGGSIGELYRQTFAFPKGIGVERGILYALPSAYTLNTWEANGGTVYCYSDAALDIYDINFNFDRSHKAR